MKKLLLLACLLLAASSSSLLAQASLRAGDSIDLRLGGAPLDEVQQFSAQYTIDDEGFLNLPFINRVKVAGLTPSQACAAIEAKLKADEIYTQPTIIINQQAQSRFVNVGGSVRAPGRVVYTPDLTLTSAINAAGGFTEFASQKNVRLVHDGKVTVHDVRKIRKDPSTDPKVYPGDQIEVAQSIW